MTKNSLISQDSPCALWTVMASILVGALFLIIVNPYWYGDATWYALELKTDGVLPLDPGHLLWIPLVGLLWKVQSLIFIPIDPLVLFQILSALATVGSALLLTKIARHLEVSHPEGIGVAFLLTNFSLLYGGSGSSYSPSVMFFLLAVLLYLSQVNRSPLQAALMTGISGALSLSFWGLGILGVPLLFFLPLLFLKSKGLALRFLHGMLLTGIAVALFSFLLLLGFLFTEPNTAIPDFLIWLYSSGHGIPARFSLLNLLRAPLGLLQSVLSLGTLGRAIKAIITGSSLPFPVLPSLLAILLSLSGIVLFLFSFSRSISSRSFLLFLLILLPTLAFGSLWQGSDVERFSLTLPFLLLFLAALINNSRIPILGGVFLLVFGGYNLWNMLLGHEAEEATLIHELVEVSGDYLPRNSLVIVTGQDLGPRIWSPAQYHSNNTFYSLLYDAQTEGVKGWKERLRKQVFHAVDAGGKIVILDSLISEHPHSPPPVLTAADPHPEKTDIFSLFKKWNVRRLWMVKEYTFVEISHSEVQNNHV